MTALLCIVLGFLAQLAPLALLVIDELGYLPIDKFGADALFQVISQRYERGSTVT